MGQDHPQSKGKLLPLEQLPCTSQWFRTAKFVYHNVISNLTIFHQQSLHSILFPTQPVYSNCTIHIYNLGFCPQGSVVSWDPGYTAKWLRLLRPHTVNYPTMSNAHQHSWVTLASVWYCVWVALYGLLRSAFQDHPC